MLRLIETTIVVAIGVVIVVVVVVITIAVQLFVVILDNVVLIATAVQWRRTCKRVLGDRTSDVAGKLIALKLKRVLSNVLFDFTLELLITFTNTCLSTK